MSNPPGSKAWFTLELVSHDGPWFELELDTNGPKFTFGVISQTGREVALPYTTDEPSVVAAQLITDSGALAMRADLDAFRFTVPEGFVSGIYTIEVTGVDDVGNISHREFQVRVEGDVEEPPEQPIVIEVGGGHPFTYGPIIRVRQEFEFSAEVNLARRTSLPVAAEINVRQLKPVVFFSEFQGELTTGRTVQLAVPGIRQPGMNLAKIVAEDDLLLLMT